jgi:formate-dependent nitrite reductase membrane component NrfD
MSVEQTTPATQQRRRRGGGRSGRGELAMVPEATPTSYYGHPVIKPPIWKPEIGVYLFTGGLAGASALLANAARRRGNDVLARRALLTAFAGVTVSPVLLVVDLGVPRRFLNMLRVAKVTSPMSVGSWILVASGTSTGAAAACEVLGILPRVQRIAETSAALLGPPLATYTGVLLADTAVPVWHEARFELPFVFAGSALASAGAAAAVLTPPPHADLARRVAVSGVATTLTGMRVMERRLGDLGEPYRVGSSGRFARLATLLGAGGAAALALGGRRRPVAVAGGVAVLAGAMCERWSIFTAGRVSASDPRFTVAPQRRRLAGGESQWAKSGTLTKP